MRRSRQWQVNLLKVAMMLVRRAPVMTTLRTGGNQKREEEMGESLEVFGLARKTRVERGWIDLRFHQTTRAGRRNFFLFEVQDTCMHFELVNSREKDRLWIWAAFYLSYRAV